MNRRSLGHRAPLLWLVLPFAGGLALGKVTGSPWIAWPLGLAGVAALLALMSHGAATWRWATALVLALTLAGFASHALHRARLSAWNTLPAREARLSLQVDRIFAQADPKRCTGLGTITRAGEHLEDLVGQRIYFSLTQRKGEVSPMRSAGLATTGVLTTLPETPAGDGFDRHLADIGINFRLTRARIIGLEKPAHAYHRFCARAADFFHRTLGEGIVGKQPALAGLLRAMMLGTTHELSESQHALFLQSGTMHLFAISGLNIGVIAGALQTLLLLLRLPSWARFVVGAALLWLFVDITGASPSAVRAFAMAVFLQAAFVLRRPANVLAALLASAGVVLLLTPLQLFGASFLMSYTIVAALLVLGLPLGETWAAGWAPWRDVPLPAWRWWQHGIAFAWRSTVTALALGVATTLVSLLTGIEFFQLLTPGSLGVNLLLIPTAMIATLGGFASLLCGMVGCAPGASLCNHAAALLLWFIEACVRLAVKLPGAFVPAHYRAEWVGDAALIALLASLLLGYATRWQRAYGGWWTPFGIVALVLAGGVRFG